MQLFRWREAKKEMCDKFFGNSPACKIILNVVIDTCACAYDLDATMSESMCRWLAVSILFLLAPDEVAIPHEWKGLLRLVCQENENASCSPPIVRDVLTFPSAAALVHCCVKALLMHSGRC